MWIQIIKQYQWQRDYFDASSFLFPSLQIQDWPKISQQLCFGELHRSEARTLSGKALYICSSYCYVIYSYKSFYVTAYTEVWKDPNHSLQPGIYLEEET